MQNKQDVQIEKLIIKAQKGDDVAFAKIYQAKWNQVYYIALKMMNNPQDASDVVQEVFITLYRKLDTLKDPKAFNAWLNTIVTNTCRNILRQRGPVTQQVDLEEVEDFLFNADDEFLPEKYLEDKMLRQSVLEAVDRLSKDQRECILLFYYQGLSIQEIAQATDQKPTTVKVRLHRGREAIRKYLGEDETPKHKGVTLLAITPIPILAAILLEDASASAAPAVGNAIWQQVAGQLSLPPSALSAGLGTPATKAATSKIVIASITAAATLTLAGVGIYWATRPDGPPPPAPIVSLSDSPSPSPSQTPSLSPSLSEAPSPTPTVSALPTQTPSPTTDASPTPQETTPSATPEPSTSPSPTPVRDKMTAFLKWYQQQADRAIRPQLEDFFAQYQFRIAGRWTITETAEYTFYIYQDEEGQCFVCEKDGGDYGISYAWTDAKTAPPASYMIPTWYQDNHP